MQEHSKSVVRTAEVIGENVYATDDTKLGEIKEIVIDKVEGVVRYAVLSSGGVLGFGDKYYAIPWKALDYCTEKQAFQINIDKDKLKAATGFDKNNWPDFMDEAWIQATQSYYNLS